MNALTTLLRRFRDLGLRQQALMAGGLLVVIIVAVILFRIATATPWATVTTGMEPADAPEVAQSLSEAGIQNRISQGGTAIQVPESELDKARATVATSTSVSGGGQVGFELFDKNSLGATDFQQRIQYQRALEGEIARTIQQIDGVRSAQVQLVLPQDQLFTDEGNPASASVLIQTSGMGLDQAQVAGIAHLVQSSVEGLQAKNITITDQTGGLLWPNDKSSETGQAAANDKQSAEERYANRLSSQLNALLVQTLGPGKAQAQVSATLNTDQTSREQLKYGPANGKVITEKTSDENLKGNGAAVAGRAGTDGNVPTYGNATRGGGNTTYKNKTAERTYGVDKTVTKTQVSPGAVEKLQVAVLLDKSVSAADETALRQTLAAAAGIDAARGDQLAISRVTFDNPAAEAAKPSGMQIPAVAKYGGLALLLLVATFLTWRGLRKREKTPLGTEPVWLSELTEPEPPTQPMQLKPAAKTVPLRREKPAVQEQVEMLADKEPAQMAHQIRSWMNED